VYVRVSNLSSDIVAFSSGSRWHWLSF